MNRPLQVRRATLLGVLCALSLYFFFVVSAGTFGLLGANTDYYDQLARGFQAGHLYLPTTPKPELLARADPYKHERPEDIDAWLWDASLYRGRYYIYWGPTPALLLWFVKGVLGVERTIHDQWLVLFFTLMRLYAGSALLVRFARVHYPTLPSWALCLAILVFGVASPTPYFLARPLIYEASIAGGQGFLCLGLYCAYRGLTEPLRQTRWFFAAGSCMACALAARASLIVSVPLIIAASAWAAIVPAGYSPRNRFAALSALAAPVLLSLLLYAGYNHLRFGAFTEFGLKYQLTGRPFETADRFFLPNLFTYFGAELAWSCKFPFVRLPDPRQLSPLITWPYDYDHGAGEVGERVGGVLVATTICWLWAVWCLRAGVWAKRWYAARRVQRALAPPFGRHESWLVLCSLASIAAVAPASRLYLASMRYLEDAAGGILFGAIAAGFWLLRPARAPNNARSRLARPLYAALALHTVFVGVCLGFTGYAETFRKENPRLFGYLESTLSVCEIEGRVLLLPSEHDANYVACVDAQPLDSRDTCQKGTPARP